MFAVDIFTSLDRQISGCCKYYMIIKLPPIFWQGLCHWKDTWNYVYILKTLKGSVLKGFVIILRKLYLHLRTSMDCVYNGCLLNGVILIKVKVTQSLYLSDNLHHRFKMIQNSSKVFKKQWVTRVKLFLSTLHFDKAEQCNNYCLALSITKGDVSRH